MKAELRAQIAEYFDKDYYALTKDARRMRMHPIDHYLKIGETRGIAPSPRFDPEYYRATYEDLKAYKGSLLLHYVRSGRHEGRSPVSGISSVALPTDRLRKTRPTILILVHDASRTGAPILAFNLIAGLTRDHNVITLLMKDGPIEAALADASTALVRLPAGLPYGSDDAVQLFRKVIATYTPQYAIANSLATRDAAVLLEKLDVPVIALVHEFSSEFRPTGTLHGVYAMASRIVFPARIVAEASAAEYSILRARDYLIAPQGVTKVPPAAAALPRPGSGRTALPAIDPDAYVVAGVGTVTYRKGVDVFISVAAEMCRRRPKARIQFVWVGHVYPFDENYKAFLRQQIVRSGLEGRVILVDELLDPTPVYRRADAYLLSSRLDPMPNSAIDAAIRGVPVVSFENAGGIAEVFGADRATRALVVPYLDVSAAARVILRLSEDKTFSASMSRAIKKKAGESFRMSRYVKLLAKLGRGLIAERRQSVRDMRTIIKAGVFDPAFCHGPDEAPRPLAQAIELYLSMSRRAWPHERPLSGLVFRRPMVGFNPLIYATSHPELRNSHEDPLAHFLRAGRPAGPWTHQVIGPARRVRGSRPAKLRVALHGHFYYPELVEDFLQRLSRNSSAIDLKITTTGTARRNAIRKLLDQYEISNAEVRDVPNHGRDLGPFFQLFQGRYGDYDVIGHVHGKRSAHAPAEIGDRWRNLAFETLLGGAAPMADIILDQFAGDPTLGLVFPEDPHLNDWDENRPAAEALAKAMKFRKPLPTHFDFPVGNMFWARPKAVKRMFDLNLEAKDYPAEPVPLDGTILHALERLWPLASSEAGFRYATTHVPGCYR